MIYFTFFIIQIFKIGRTKILKKDNKKRLIEYDIYNMYIKHTDIDNKFDIYHINLLRFMS